MQAQRSDKRCTVLCLTLREHHYTTLCTTRAVSARPAIISIKSKLWAQAPVRRTLRLRDCSLILSNRSSLFFTCLATLDTSSMSSCMHARSA